MTAQRTLTRLVTLVALPAALLLAAVVPAPAAAGTTHRIGLDPASNSGALAGAGIPVNGEITTSGKVPSERTITVSRDVTGRGEGLHAGQSGIGPSGNTQYDFARNEVSGALVAAGGVAFVAVASALALGRRRPSAAPTKPAGASAPVTDQGGR
ncbi:hypothetical protein [Streptomyces sp. NPDC055287]